MTQTIDITQNTEVIQQAMRIAIDEGKKCISEKGKLSPKVGAVIVKDKEILGCSYRGELGEGEHAEYTLLERKLKGEDLSGAILFTTLEPCTTRNPPKYSCCHWIISRKNEIKCVYIGMLDRNPKIYVKGCTELSNEGIEVRYFTDELRGEIEGDNIEFLKQFKENPDSSGKVSFGYTNNNGQFRIGGSDHVFDTKWSVGEGNSIWFERCNDTVKTIAIAEGNSNIYEIKNAGIYTTDSDRHLISVGDILAIRNSNGFWAAIKILEIHCKQAGANRNELIFEYQIRHDGTSDFSSPVITRKSKKIDELTGLNGYFSPSDYFNIQLFKRIFERNPETEIEKLFFQSLLLFDRVILHSTDPLRSEFILKLLEDNQEFIKDGWVNFVFSEDVKNNISKEYRTYIDERKAAYRKSIDDAKWDLESLEQGHITPQYYDRVIDILSKAKELLNKQEKGLSKFNELLKDDIAPFKEWVIMKNDDFEESQFRFLNLSLWQLLNLRHCEDRGPTPTPIFDSGAIKNLVTSYRRLKTGPPSLTRHTVFHKILQKAGIEGTEDNLPRQHALNAIEARLSLLFSKMQCGKCRVIDFFSEIIDRDITFSTKYFSMFVETALGEDRQLNKKIVIEIRNSSLWPELRYLYFTSMALIMSRKSSALSHELNEDLIKDEVYIDILEQLNVSMTLQELRKKLKEENR